MTIFNGSGVALVTPFHEDGSVNYEKLEELLEFHCKNRTDGIVVCGTTGEASTLSTEEHLEVVRFTVECVNGRIPVIAGTGSNNTMTAIATSKGAAEAGVDGLLIVTPYYNKCTQTGLFLHYQKIAEQVETPIILYNVPGRTGVNLMPETVAELFHKIKNIVGIKEASGNISQAARIMNLTDGQIDLYAGNDDMMVPILALGGKGVISVLANLVPQFTHELCEKMVEGKLLEGMRMQNQAMPLIDALFLEVNPIPIKKALKLIGMDVGNPRMPLTDLTKEHTQKLMVQMVEFGIPIQLSKEVGI